MKIKRFLSAVVLGFMGFAQAEEQTFAGYLNAQMDTEYMHTATEQMETILKEDSNAQFYACAQAGVFFPFFSGVSTGICSRIMFLGRTIMPTVPYSGYFSHSLGTNTFGNISDMSLEGRNKLSKWIRKIKSPNKVTPGGFLKRMVDYTGGVSILYVTSKDKYTLLDGKYANKSIEIASSWLGAEVGMMKGKKYTKNSEQTVYLLGYRAGSAINVKLLDETYVMPMEEYKQIFVDMGETLQEMPENIKDFVVDLVRSIFTF